MITGCIFQLFFTFSFVCIGQGKYKENFITDTQRVIVFRANFGKKFEV